MDQISATPAVKEDLKPAATNPVQPKEPEPEISRNGKIVKTGKRTFLTFILLVILFGLAFQFQARMGELGPVDDIGLRTKDVFESYYLFAGFGFGLLSGVLFLLINIFSRFLRAGRFIFYFITIGLSILPWYFFARHLVLFENRYADFAKAVISYLGYPLLAAVKLLFIFLLIYLVIYSLTKVKDLKAVLRVLILLVLPFSLSGCLGGTAGLVCFLMPDSDHCYQAAAVQEADAAGCAKIKGEDFADSNSNPPRDKCYLMIANNTGDLSACENIKGGMFSYTREECILSTSLAHVNPGGCLKLSGADKETCVSGLADKITSGSVMEIDEQIKVLKDELKNRPDADLQQQLDGLEGKRNDYLAVMSDKQKQEYAEISDPRNQDAVLDYHLGKIDKPTKEALVALNNSLREKNSTMSEQEYQAIRDYLVYRGDPKNNIENMDDNEIVKLRWNEKLGNGAEFFKFWKANKTSTEEKYDQQLLFYERMLERQAAIEQGLSEKQADFDRNMKIIGDQAAKQAISEALDYVSGPANITAAVVGEALDVVKAEAKSKEFRGLVRAYNLGMQEELAKAGGDVEKAHAAVVANLQQNAYSYEDQNTFAKYENLLINKDCDGSNPHCLNKDVFWKSMKKSYKYQQAGAAR